MAFWHACISIARVTMELGANYTDVVSVWIWTSRYAELAKAQVFANTTTDGNVLCYPTVLDAQATIGSVLIVPCTPATGLPVRCVHHAVPLCHVPVVTLLACAQPTLCAACNHSVQQYLFKKKAV